MIFEPFDPKIHSIEKLAELIYEVDFRTFDWFFKTKEDAVKAINNKYIYELQEDLDENFFIYAILDDNRNIIGMCDGSVGVDHSFFKEILGTFKHLRFIEALKLSAVIFLDSFALAEVHEKDFYIADVAIVSSQRRKGYGSQVISELIEIAKMKDCDRVILDADFRNDGAYRLYKSMGFKEFKKKGIKLPFFKRGMRNMEYKLR